MPSPSSFLKLPTTTVGPVSQIPSMFQCGTLKNTHTIGERVGHEVPGVVAVFCASIANSVENLTCSIK